MEETVSADTINRKKNKQKKNSSLLRTKKIAENTFAVKNAFFKNVTETTVRQLTE